MSGPHVWLDRANEWQVRWRLAGRQPVPVRAALERWLDEPWVRTGAELEPRRVAPGRPGGEERWRDPARGWHARRWLPRRPAPGRPAVVLLHPWLATPLHLRIYRLLAAPLTRAGADLWVPVLPEHLERTGPGRVSGERCVSADLVRTAESIRTGVAETVALAGWLRGRGASRVCLWGISLGGWVGALTATETDDLDGVVLWEPVADPRETLRLSPLAAEVRRALEMASVSPELLGELLRELTPVARPLRVPRERVLVVGGRQDTVVPAATIRRLGRRWGVATLWLEHAHISLVGARRARRASVDFLRGRLEPRHA